MTDLAYRKVFSDHDLFEIVEHYRGQEAAERFSDCLSDLPEYPVEGLMDRLNQELSKLGLLIQIEDLVRKEPDQYVWTCMIGLFRKESDQYVCQYVWTWMIG